MQQQAERGIWAKLWAFPTEPILPKMKTVALPPLKHRLTHRLLNIQPVYVEINSEQAEELALLAQSHTQSGQWLSVSDAHLKLALPKPAEKLVRSLLTLN